MSTNLEEAQAQAEELDRRVYSEGIDSAYESLQVAIDEFEADGYPLASIIPAGSSPDLGFSLKSADGHSFFEIYSDLLRDSLCNEGGEFNSMATKGINATVPAILAAIVAALGIPAVALGLMVPIAVIVANTGVQAFCRTTDSEPADESG